MRLHELLNRLGITPIPECDPEIPPHKPADAEKLIGIAVEHGLAPELADAMRPHAVKACQDPLLMQYFHFLAEKLFNDHLSLENMALLPQETKLPREEEWACWALMAFTGIYSRREVFTAAGLPEKCVDGAILDIFVWIRHFYANTGVAGLPTRMLLWEYYVQNGVPLRFGRLQFGCGRFNGPVTVYRHKETGKLQVLSDGGVRFNPAGMAIGELPEPRAWTSIWKETKKTLTANPVRPDGWAVKTPVNLDLAEWECVLKKGDSMLETHIPEGPPLDLNDCKASMTEALTFFKKRYPERDIRGFFCCSWLLDPQFEFILSPKSRILAFMYQYHLYPTYDTIVDSVWRIFGEDDQFKPVAELPRRTSMQVRVADFLAKGGRLGEGGGFLLSEDLERYGTMPYQAR